MSIEVVNSAIKWKETTSKLTLSTQISAVKNLVKPAATITTPITSSSIDAISSSDSLKPIATNKESGKIAGNQSDDNENDTNSKIDIFERDIGQNENLIENYKIFNKNNDKNSEGSSNHNNNNNNNSKNNNMMLDLSSEKSLSLPPIPGLIPIRKTNLGGCSNNNNNNNNKSSKNKNTKKCSSSLLEINDTNLTNDTKSIVEEKIDIDEDGFVVNKIYVEKLSTNKAKEIEIQNNEKLINQNQISSKKTNIRRNNKKTKIQSNEINNRKSNDSKNENKEQQHQIRLKISCKSNEIKEKLNKNEMNGVSLKNMKTEKMLISEIQTSNNMELKNNQQSITNPITPIMPQKIVDNQQINQNNTLGVNDLMKCKQPQKKRGRKSKAETLAIKQQQELQNQQTSTNSTAVSGNAENAIVNASQPSLSSSLPPPVQHRKSDRRRMPRDIFFFFEEPRSNRKGKANKNKKTNRRNFKNNKNCTDKIVSLPSSSSSASSSSLLKQSQVFQDNASISNNTKKSKFSIKNMKKELSNDTDNSNNCTPKVNPIFLWVKQDHTRIIEVRCEDYDKRNRIRLTKTASGWRAMPRTDPTTSRVVKLLPNPLVRIKPEFQRSNLLEVNNKNDKIPNNNAQNNILTQSQQENQQQQQQPRLKVKSYPPFENTINKIKEHKNKKKKKRKKRKHSNTGTDNELEKSGSSIEDPAKKLLENEEIRELLSDEPKEVIVYESINHEQVEEEEILPLSTKQHQQLSSQEIAAIEKSDAIPITSVTSLCEPNNNNKNNNSSITIDTTAMTKSKNMSNNLIHQIDNTIDLSSMQFMQNLQGGNLSSPSAMLCSQQTTNIFNQTSNSQSTESIINTAALAASHSLSTDHIDLTIDTFDPSDVVCNDVNAKQLKDLLDDPDLLQHCGDNGISGISGEELINSLMKHGCEDNNLATIIDDDDDEMSVKPSQQKQEKQNLPDEQKFQQNSCSNITKDISSLVPTTTICLDDFDNEDDDLLMQPEPVEDIISRLGDSLTDSPKCLSFNEAGEIEGLHGELFQTSNHSIPFNPTTTLEELSITIKDLEKSSESLNSRQTTEASLVTTKSTTATISTATVTSTVSTPTLSANTTTMVSPDSCVADELPKDLTCKKNASVNQTSNSSSDSHQPERVLSRSSDAIQSPQPSGLPAVPPSPDIIHSRSTTLKTITNKPVFHSQISRQEPSSPKIVSSTPTNKSVLPPSNSASPANVQQKEPLDLGKHRKSGSPTITCSEEANRNRLNNNNINNVITIDDDNDHTDCEPLEKRIKMENLTATEGKNHTATLIEMLSSGKDPDPLTQLRLLINNSEWKVPDPILVPKDRLSAVLMSPAREIPLLLTTRPELRLPEAFAYPAILQDPDILVISLAQLEAILQKHIELINKTKSISNIPQVNIEPVSKARTEKPKTDEIKAKKIQETALLNQQRLLNPLAQRLASNCLANEIDAATLAAFNQMLWLPYLGQMAPELFKAMVGFSKPNNLTEIFSFLNQQVQQQQQQQHQQQQQQHTQSQAQQQHHKQTNSSSPLNSTGLPFQNPLEFAMWQEALNQMQLQRSLGLNGVSSLNQQREQQKKNDETKANANNSNFNLAALFNQKSLSELQKCQQQQMRTSTAATRTVNEMVQSRKVQQNHNQLKQNLSDKNTTNQQHKSVFTKAKQNQMHQNQQQLHHQYGNSGGNEQKPRVTCKSLSNLLQPERLVDNSTTNSSLIENKMSNLMAIPSFDFNSSGGLHHHQRAQQSLHQIQAAAISQQLNSQQLHHQSQFNTNHFATATAAATAASAMNNDTIGCNNSFMNSNYMTNNAMNSSGTYHQIQTQQQQNKVKSKNGSHLLDSNAMQRRLMNCDDVTEIGNTGTNLDELMNDPTAHLWHPLFGSHQKSSYNSPWQWTTVTATGE